MSYNRDLVEQLLPTVWDRTYAFGMSNPTASDPDMPKSSTNKAHGCTLYAHLADIQYAWNRTHLPPGERVALFLSYGMGWSDTEIGFNQDVTDRAIRYRIERGLDRIVSFLNGTEYDPLFEA